VTTEQSPSRALTGLAPRRSLGPDPSLALLRRDNRPDPAVGAVDGSAAPTAPAARSRVDAVPSPAPAGQSIAVPDTDPASVSDSDSPSGHAGGGGEGLPRYLQLTRKEARIRKDQANQLAEQVRRLNQARVYREGTVGERITDNTLIRVAVDLLLARVDSLSGSTEDELRNSVSP
jgi:hypothetical protein